MRRMPTPPQIPVRQSSCMRIDASSSENLLKFPPEPRAIRDTSAPILVLHQRERSLGCRGSSSSTKDLNALTQLQILLARHPTRSAPCPWMAASQVSFHSRQYHTLRRSSTRSWDSPCQTFPGRL